MKAETPTPRISITTMNTVEKTNVLSVSLTRTSRIVTICQGRSGGCSDVVGAAVGRVVVVMAGSPHGRHRQGGERWGCTPAGRARPPAAAARPVPLRRTPPPPSGRPRPARAARAPPGPIRQRFRDCCDPGWLRKAPGLLVLGVAGPTVVAIAGAVVLTTVMFRARKQS